MTIIGYLGYYLNDIAFDSSGNLYGIGDQLYKIDPSTGSATPIAGPLGLSSITSLEFGSDDGTLYAANDSLCTVNPLTGIGAVIGKGGDPYISSGDLALLGSQMYLTSTYNSSTDSLFRINQSTGVGTFVGQIGYPNVYGMVTNDNVTLYGFSGNKVIQIDPATGAGSTNWDINGMSGLSTINGAAFH